MGHETIEVAAAQANYCELAWMIRTSIISSDASHSHITRAFKNLQTS